MIRMPLGPWKSRWEIHREVMEQRHAEYREEMRAAHGRSDEIAAETRDLRADYTQELAETRLFNRELLTRMEKTYAGLGSTMEFMGEELLATRQEIHELKNAVNAQTDAILRLVDRFEDPDGRPPV
jgi:hypothetical protein